MEKIIMKAKEKIKAKKSKKIVSSIVMYIAATVIALIGIALLVDNIIQFKAAMSQYISQGYSAATVKQQLIPSQLLPSIFDSIGVYGGISFILVAAGIINTKLSKLLTKDEVLNDVNDENTLKSDITPKEDTKI